MRRSIARGLLFISLLFMAAPCMSQSTGLTLAQAYDLARKGSEAIRLKELALQKSRLGVNQATSSALPHVDMQASASYLANPPQGYTVTAGELGSFSPAIPPGGISIPHVYSNPTAIPLGSVTIPPTDIDIGAQLHNYFSVAATLSQPLFTWGKIKNAIDAAALQADAAGTDLVTQQRDIDREVNRAYYSALLAEESEKILERIRNTAAQIVADRQKSFDQGTINKEAVLEAQSNQASIEARLAEATQSSLTARESLGILTGLDPAGITLSTSWSPSLPPLDEQALLETALKESTDMAAGRTRVSLAQKKLAIEKGGSMLLPDASLGVSLAVTGQEDIPYADWSWNNTTWTWDLVISLGVKMSAFDGLSSHAAIGQAEKDAEMAATGLTQTEKLVRLNVRKAIDAAIKADADVKENQAKAEYAEERLKNARVSFDNGSASHADLYGADIMEGSVQLDLLLALYTRDEALADIAQITGEAE
ncbi:MAG: TolC family protein [Spirochaetia bacterium]|jgi:outer membrane protein TolC